MRYKVTRGRGKGGWGSATGTGAAFIIPSRNPPEGCQKKESSVAQDFPSDRDDWWLHKPPVDV